MFNFLNACDEVSINAASTSVTVATPNWKALFGSWWVLATSDAA